MATITDNLNTLQAIKGNIKNAIETKGVDVGDAPFTEYASKINEIVVDPIDGSYDEGYAEGFTQGDNEGYNRGFGDGTASGIAVQKDKLTAITVDENGVYSREDGYSEVTVSIDTDYYYDKGFNNGFSNGKTEGQTEGYNSGYDAGKTDGISEGYGNGYNAGRTDGYEIGKTDGETAIKANMQSITITQNGPYSDERGYKQIIVNVVGDSNAGYDEGYSTGYDNGYADGYTSGTTDGSSVGYDKGVTDTKVNMRTVTMTKNGVYSDENGYKEVTVSVDVETPYNNGYVSGYTDGVMSSGEGCVIKIGEGTKFRTTEFSNSILTIDCENIDDLSGLFYDAVFLTDNGMPLINTSGVTNTKQMFYNTNIKIVPYFDTTSVTDAWEMFRSCKNLISVPDLVLPSIKRLYGAFYGCEKLVQAPNITVGSGLTDMGYMFNGCSSLENIQLFDTSNVTDMMSVFNGCKNLKEIPQFNTSKAKYITYMFNGCTSLETIPLLDFSSVTSSSLDLKYCASLINLGGFQNYIGGHIYLYGSENITRESMLNVFNTIGEANYEILIKRAVYDRLTEDDIAIATNKGWTISIR